MRARQPPEPWADALKPLFRIVVQACVERFRAYVALKAKLRQDPGSEFPIVQRCRRAAKDLGDR